MTVTNLRLPNFFDMCPFPVAVNPLYERARAETSAWVERFNIFDARKIQLLVEQDFELLAAMTFVEAGYDQLRVCCDFIALLFVYDELSDKQDGEGAESSGYVFLKAMYGEPVDNSPLSQITFDFSTRLKKLSTPKALGRFLQYCTQYANAVSKEADLRTKKNTLGLDAYCLLRRENSALRPCFALLEIACGIELPDKVVNHPTFLSLCDRQIDIVCLANDVCSYPIEHARGIDCNNYVNAAVHDKGFSLQDGFNYIGEEFGRQVKLYVDEKSRFPSFADPELDALMVDYMEAVSSWSSGNLIWSFQSPRYFGKERSKVKETMEVVVGEWDECPYHY